MEVEEQEFILEGSGGIPTLERKGKTISGISIMLTDSDNNQDHFIMIDDSTPVIEDIDDNNYDYQIDYEEENENLNHDIQHIDNKNNKNVDDSEKSLIDSNNNNNNNNNVNNIDTKINIDDKNIVNLDNNDISLSNNQVKEENINTTIKNDIEINTNFNNTNIIPNDKPEKDKIIPSEIKTDSTTSLVNNNNTSIIKPLDGNIDNDTFNHKKIYSISMETALKIYQGEFSNGACKILGTDMDVLANFMSLFNFSSLGVEESLRVFASKFILEGESQLIDRVLEYFSHYWWDSNDELRFSYGASDVVYSIVFSILMLNTDLHKVNIKHIRKITKKDYINNVMGQLHTLEGFDQWLDGNNQANTISEDMSNNNANTNSNFTTSTTNNNNVHEQNDTSMSLSEQESRRNSGLTRTQSTTISLDNHLLIDKKSDITHSMIALSPTASEVRTPITPDTFSPSSFSSESPSLSKKDSLSISPSPFLTSRRLSDTSIFQSTNNILTMSKRKKRRDFEKLLGQIYDNIKNCSLPNGNEQYWSPTSKTSLKHEDSISSISSNATSSGMTTPAKSKFSLPRTWMSKSLLAKDSSLANSAMNISSSLNNSNGNFISSSKSSPKQSSIINQSSTVGQQNVLSSQVSISSFETSSTNNTLNGLQFSSSPSNNKFGSVNNINNYISNKDVGGLSFERTSTQYSTDSEFSKSDYGKHASAFGLITNNTNKTGPVIYESIINRKLLVVKNGERAKNRAWYRFYCCLMCNDSSGLEMHFWKIDGSSTGYPFHSNGGSNKNKLKSDNSIKSIPDDTENNSKLDNQSSVGSNISTSSNVSNNNTNNNNTLVYDMLVEEPSETDSINNKDLVVRKQSINDKSQINSEIGSSRNNSGRSKHRSRPSLASLRSFKSSLSKSSPNISNQIDLNNNNESNNSSNNNSIVSNSQLPPLSPSVVSQGSSNNNQTIGHSKTLSLASEPINSTFSSASSNGVGYLSANSNGNIYNKNGRFARSTTSLTRSSSNFKISMFASFRKNKTNNNIFGSMNEFSNNIIMQQQEGPTEIIKLQHSIAQLLPSPGYSKERPNVFNIRLVDDTVYIIETDTEYQAKQWVEKINYWASRKSKTPFLGEGIDLNYGWGVELNDDFNIDGFKIREWVAPPPAGPLVYIGDENDHIEAIKKLVAHFQKEVTIHSGYRVKIENKFSNYNNLKNKANNNWCNKMQYLQKELNRYATYLEYLNKDLDVMTNIIITNKDDIVPDNKDKFIEETDLNSNKIVNNNDTENNITEQKDKDIHLNKDN